LIEPRERLTPAKLAARAAGSLAAHIALYAIFSSLPDPPPRIADPIQLAEMRQAVHIVYPHVEKKPEPPPPPKELTQKAPNKGKICENWTFVVLRKLRSRAPQRHLRRRLPQERAHRPNQ